MKRYFAFLAVLTLTFCTSSARGAPQHPYAGLFVDEYHMSMVAVYTPPDTAFAMWIWWLPSEAGMRGVEFQILYPSNVGASPPIHHDNIYMILGSLSGGAKAYYIDCQSDWVWVCHQPCVTTGAAPSMIQIVAYPGEAAVKTSTCQSGYPFVDTTVLCNIYVNQCAFFGVERSSWGAIKSLYR